MKQWSGRFSKKTNKLTEQFTTSLPFDKRLYKYDIKGSIAHVGMLAKCKIISLDEADEIIDALQEIFHEIDSGKFTFDEALEDIHMSIERALIDKVGPVGGKLHTARSRNDQIALDMRMYVKDEIVTTCQLILDFQKALLELARNNKDVVMPGFTHLQHGQPVLFSHHLMAYFFMLERDFNRLSNCLYKEVDVMPLGAGAFAGTSFPIDSKYVAAELGFSKVVENSIDAVSNRDFVVQFLSNLSLVMVHLSRLSEELILWSTSEFSFVGVDEAYTTGSSVMPQKKNPDVCELIRAKAGRVFGHLTSMLTVLKGLPLTYNRDLQEDKEGLFDAVDTTKASLEVLAGVISSLKVNVDKMKKAAEAGFTTATDVADYLAKKGVPFRQAHELTGKIVKSCLDKGCSFSDLNFKDWQNFSSLFEKDIFETIDLESSINSKASPGGTSPKRVEEQLKVAQKLLDKEKEWLSLR